MFQGKFPDNREFNREFFDFRLFPRFWLVIDAQNQWLAAKFPTKRNREFFSRNREFFGANREFQGKVASHQEHPPANEAFHPAQQRPITAPRGIPAATAAAPLADMKRAAASRGVAEDGARRHRESRRKTKMSRPGAARRAARCRRRTHRGGARPARCHRPAPPASREPRSGSGWDSRHVERRCPRGR
jgi:hypothetical protein